MFVSFATSYTICSSRAYILVSYNSIALASFKFIDVLVQVFTTRKMALVKPESLHQGTLSPSKMETSLKSNFQWRFIKEQTNNEASKLSRESSPVFSRADQLLL